jgi:2-methylisocitrate lyase-like PEP mutase family enzyme
MVQFVMLGPAKRHFELVTDFCLAALGSRHRRDHLQHYLRRAAADGTAWTRPNFEDAVSAAIEKRIGMPATIFDSSNYGVIAIERLTGSDADKINWQEVAAELARTTGVGVTCIANCD